MSTEALKPVTLYDLYAAQRKIGAKRPERPQGAIELLKRVEGDPGMQQWAHEVRSRGRGLLPAFYSCATVVSADNVLRYIDDTTSGREFGTGMLLLPEEVLEIFGTASAAAVVPPYPVMFIEAKAVDNFMGIDSFGWTVVRVPRDEGGWEMQASLIVEWEKGRPVGPLFTLLWELDGQGRYVKEMRDGKRHPSLPQLAVMYPTDPCQSDPDLLERMCAPYLDGFNGAIALLGLTLGFMNCKNVTQVDNDPPARLSRAHRKRRGRPLTRYQTLDIRPMTRALDRDGRAREVGLGQALHTCRGHFKTYKPESPLFGRVSGQFWWQEHERGEARNGEVVKGYRPHPPRRAGQVGEGYRKAAASNGPTSAEDGTALAAHQRLQDQVAAALADRGLRVLSPAPTEPQYDLACEANGGLWLIEVKTTTAANETGQVRAAIGQVLHYQEILREVTTLPLHCAIAVGSAPRDAALERTCRGQGIELVWPGTFADFADGLTNTPTSS
ncbi:hypothetical protein [Nocardiopsis baichengensis]|uniref:hypothetical protein n=1 Tax=Nocardiopsis baichengensis TaxID=280240 RepID=UPI001EF9FE14|nr:hypothetical protein [Nocardiopsis baichengensis]